VQRGSLRGTLADVTMSQVHPASRARRRRAWTRLGVVSTLALGAGVVADLVYGDGSHLTAILVIGLSLVCVVAGFIAIPAQDDGGVGDSERRIGGWG
jgi:hypothetical protein